MTRTIISFLIGVVMAFVALQGLCRMFLRFVEGEPAAAEIRRSMNSGEYQRWVDNRYELPFMFVSLSGSLACGFLCGWAAVDAGARSRPRPDGEPLTHEEKKQAIASCLWADLTDRGPAYVQGLIVGRLAESEPIVARKVAGLGDEQMARLLRKVLRRKHA